MVGYSLHQLLRYVAAHSGWHLLLPVMGVMRQTKPRRFRFAALAQCQPVAVFPFVVVRFYRLVREHLLHFLR